MATRHNFGFLLLDRVSRSLQESGTRLTDSGTVSGDARWERFELEDTQVLLLWPLTYMNLSGEAVVRRLRTPGFADFDPRRDLLVAFDDLSLPLGRVRIRAKGSSGGHNGLKSMEANLGHSEYSRLKLGIGRPDAGSDVVDHVLSPFAEAELETVESVLEFCAPQAQSWLKGISVGELAQSINGWRADQERSEEKID